MRISSALLSLAVVLAGLPTLSAQNTCTGLCLQQVPSCPNGGTTTISGTIYAPNGIDPLPDILVYVPNAPVPAFTPGVSCPVVGAPPPGSPLVGTTTAVDGTFTITNVPVGTAIPLVAQTGRWRRQTTIDTTACTDNPVPADSIRMPRTAAEGDIPKFAIATGSADQVECVLHKMGMDPSVFSDGGGTGRIQFYLGTGSPGASYDANTPSATTLMGDLPTLESYDVLMLPCEGGEYYNDKPTVDLQNLVQFANAGGRVYSSHYSYAWMRYNPPFDQVVNWIGNQSDPPNGPATIDTTFYEGQTLAQWLQVVHAGTTPGQIGLTTIRHDLNGVNAPTQSWATLNSTKAVMQFVFDTPVATANQCGRVLFNEYHVENPTNSPTGQFFPAECDTTTALTDQEKLLEFSLFELTADGSAATLTPASADFGTEPVNFTTAAQTFTWTNKSTFSSSVKLLQSSTADFLVSGNCTSVAPNASCQISVAFKPTAVGPRTGVLTVGSSGSNLTANLTGIGIPDLVFSLNALDFGSIDVGASLTKSFTVTNNANGVVNVPGLVTTGDYSVTNSCNNSVPALGTCVISVTFQPTTAGARPGTLAINSADPAYTGTGSTLTGDGLDFSAAMTPTSGTVIAGYSANTSFVTTPLGGFNANLNLTCTTNAPGSTCTLGTNSYASGSAVTTKVLLSTTAQYAVVGYGGLGAGYLWIVGLGAGALVFFGRRRLGTAARAGLVLILVTVAAFSLTGCSGKVPAKNPNATLPGSYTYTITATDGFLVRSATYGLNVTVK